MKVDWLGDNGSMLYKIGMETAGARSFRNLRKMSIRVLGKQKFRFWLCDFDDKTFNRYRNQFSPILKNFWELLDPKNTKVDVVIIRKPNLKFKIRTFFFQ